MANRSKKGGTALRARRSLTSKTKEVKPNATDTAHAPR